MDLYQVAYATLRDADIEMSDLSEEKRQLIVAIRPRLAKAVAALIKEQRVSALREAADVWDANPDLDHAHLWLRDRADRIKAGGSE